MRDNSYNSGNTTDNSYVQTVVTVSNIQTVTGERGRQNYNLFLSPIRPMINGISEKRTTWLIPESRRNIDVLTNVTF